MQNSLIPGLDILSINDNETGNTNPFSSPNQISLPFFGDNFDAPIPLSHGNCRSIQEFKKVKSIKDGVFQHIYQSQDLQKNKTVTLVRYRKLKELDEELKDLLRELDFVRNLKHYHILQYYETVTSQLTVYLVYEPFVCYLSDLFEQEVENLYQSPMVKNIMLQLLEALNYIHEFSIMHRNIHPGSIVITADGCLKVSNFRNARWLWDGNLTVQTDEIRYQAPELLMHTNICGTSVDIWSAACIFVQLLLQRPLFEENYHMRVLSEIYNIFGLPTKECWPEFYELPGFEFLYHDELKIHSYNYLRKYLKKSGHPQNNSTIELLQWMFCHDPKHRATAVQCSSHRFFSEEPKACGNDQVTYCKDIALTRQTVQKIQEEKEKERKRLEAEQKKKDAEEKEIEQLKKLLEEKEMERRKLQEEEEMQ